LCPVTYGCRMEARVALSPEHLEYLREHAITDEVLQAQGVRSEGERIVFTWRDAGTATEQTRLWPEPEGYEGPKYAWEKGKPLHFNVLRDTGAGPILLVEGTKQSLAVASWADEAYAVYAMAGCWGWSKCDKSVFESRHVYVVLDGDAGDNRDVYEAGAKLAEALDLEDAGCSFVQLPVAGKEGADDWLSGVPEGKRAERLDKLIAKATAKPAPRKPAQKARKAQDTTVPTPTGDRPVVAINVDRLEVITNVTGALKERVDGKTLFNYGNKLTRLDLDEASTHPLNEGDFLKVLVGNVACYTYTEATATRPASYKPAWPDAYTVKSVMSSQREFTPLDRVTRTPFIRDDGTVRLKPGYDTSTRTALVMDEDMAQVSVSSSPTQAQAVAAAKLILDEWLGDMPFFTRASRANALAMVLTPFVRGHKSIKLAPMAVINGLQPGVGKNLLADCLSLLVTGKVAAPLPYVSDSEEETRKQITAAFRSGAELFVYDEAHLIQGAQLSRAVTSITYTDRVLGVSDMVEYPNKVTWVALGNQVVVNSDMARRTYQVQLRPEGARPEDRHTTVFRHPDLKQWTTDHRPSLVSAVLTILSSWYAAGRPAHDRGASMGSFENWDQLMTSVLAYVGVEGFLEDLLERRSEGNYTDGYWSAHIEWLAETFEHDEFVAADVRDKALTDYDAYESPPGLDDASEKGFTRRLGREYGKIRDRWYGSHKVVKTGMGHQKTLKWRVVSMDEEQAQGGDGTEGPSVPPQGPLDPFPPAGHPEHPDTPAFAPQDDPEGVMELVPDRIGFDLETRSADALWTTEHGQFVKLTGYADRVDTAPDRLIRRVREGAVLVGHHILGFDLPALEVHHGLRIEESYGRVRDTEIQAMLADPPTSYETKAGPGFKSYALGAVAERVLGRAKDIRGTLLVREYGSWDDIPAGDARYQAYCADDVQLAVAVHEALPWTPYMAREMRVQAIMARMTLNGFRVDEPLLTRMVREGRARKAVKVEKLVTRYGIPTTDSKGVAYKSPLASGQGKRALVTALEAMGVTDYPTTPKNGEISVGKDGMVALRDRHPENKDLVELCDLVAQLSGERTIYQTIADHVVDGRVHPDIWPRQASGRWSVTEPGLTVVGKRGELSRERNIFLPEEGEVIIAVDLGQIDMRVVAVHAQDPNYLELFGPGRDVHSEIATAVFGTAENGNRHRAKATGHGWNYGRSCNAIAEAEGIDLQVVQQFDRSMRQRFPLLTAWQRRVREQGAAGLLLDNGFGRPMRVEPQNAYTQAPAQVGQGGTRDVMAECLLRLTERHPETLSMLRTIVHDEIVFSVPRHSARDIADTIIKEFTHDWAPKGCSLPVRVIADSTGPGSSWGDAYKARW